MNPLIIRAVTRKRFPQNNKEGAFIDTLIFICACACVCLCIGILIGFLIL